MSDKWSGLGQEYASALEEFLAAGGEAALQHAYEIGRKALAKDMGVLDIAAIHQHAVIRILGKSLSPEESARVAQSAEDFFAECLSPAEMVMRGFREANAALRELNQKLSRQTAALAAANEELEAFSHSVSHDLRAPLRHVNGYVEMLVEEAEGQLSPEAKRYLQVIGEASRRMDQLIDDLLAFSRMNRAEMQAAQVDLTALVREGIRDLEMSTRGRNIEWQLAPLPAATGDPAMLRQVFANLLGNAVKYTQPREAAVIEIGSAGEENGQVIVFVRDNGVGFEMKYADKLFGVFQRLHRAEDFEGTGIGLASVRRIIARHGGRVWAEGKAGEGATFYFSLSPERRQSGIAPASP